MSQVSFINLRTQSSYSIYKGLLSPSRIVDLAIQHKKPYVSMTDFNFMLKSIDFYSYAKDKNIKPIIGFEGFIDLSKVGIPCTYSINSSKLLFIAKNKNGLLLLNRVISKAHLENTVTLNEMSFAFLKLEYFENENVEDLIVLSSNSLFGEVDDIREIVLDRKAIYKSRLSLAQSLSSFFKGNYHIELMRYGQEYEIEIIKFLASIAIQGKLAPVATHPVLFEKREDFLVHEVRLCITEKSTLYGKRNSHVTNDQHYKTDEEMAHLFQDIPEALSNSVALAEQIELDIQLYSDDLPVFARGKESEKDLLVKYANEGLVTRLKAISNEENFNKEKYAEYFKRLDFELSTILKMGFEGYFLIVWDFIRYAKEQNILVGAGRGSGAGSLVAYSLRITDINPIEFDLLFERFLNPERVSMPDFDIDFEATRRHEVIEYVFKKYNDLNQSIAVSQIATYGLLKPKALIKAIARVLGVHIKEATELSSLVPKGELGITWEDVSKLDSVITARRDRGVAAKIFSYCEQLENIPVSVGVHAGGVVIAKDSLTNYTPISKNNDSIFSMFDKSEVEKAGLVKFDFLALSNLTIIEKTLLSLKNKGIVDLDISKIKLDDERVFNDIFKKGRTVGVFQFESSGMQQMLVNMNPTSFDDLIAAISLYRPGPLQSGMVDIYNSRKTGDLNIDYYHEKLIPILMPTRGVIIYQEQVMQIAQVLGGFSLGEADLLRRAMGKKDIKTMESLKTKFIESCAIHTPDLNKEVVIKLFDLIEKFAGYGFNKSHAAAYALIAYQTAYLKTYYTLEFLTSFLNVVAIDKKATDTDKMLIILNDIKDYGFKVISPNVNKANSEFECVDDCVYFGLSGIKGITDTAIKLLTDEVQSNGIFKSFTDFCLRVGGKLNKRVFKGLALANAFSCFNEFSQSYILHNLDNYVDFFKKEKAYEKTKKTKEPPKISDIKLQDCAPFTILEQCDAEYQAYGFNFIYNRFVYYKNVLGSQAPFNRRKELIKLINGEALKNIDYDSQSSHYIVCGVFTDIEEGFYNGERVIFFTLLDETGSYSSAFFNKGKSNDGHEDVYKKLSTFKALDYVYITCSLNQSAKDGRIYIGNILSIEGFQDQIKEYGSKIATFDVVRIKNGLTKKQAHDLLSLKSDESCKFFRIIKLDNKKYIINNELDISFLDVNFDLEREKPQVKLNSSGEKGDVVGRRGFQPDRRYR